MAKRRSLIVGRKIQGEVEMIETAATDHPVMITVPNIDGAGYHCRQRKSKVRDFGKMWDSPGKSAEICPIDWSGSAGARAPSLPGLRADLARYNAWAKPMDVPSDRRLQ
jgi:hypothetical protein